MKLDSILSANRVTTDVAVTSKKQALEKISSLLATADNAPAADEILGSLAGREKLGSTGLGHGVAIPHGRVAGIHDSVAAFVRLRHAVEYDSHDSEPVDLVFGLLVPDNSTGEHLKHLATVAEKFSDEGFCAKVRDSADAAQLFTLLTA